MVEPRRLKAWSALSDLFLDTELADEDYARIARLVAETGYATDEVQEILWQEVYPVLAPNLMHVAGVWDGWPEGWLLENIKVSNSSESHRPSGSVAREIAGCWARVEPLLRVPG